MKMALGIEYNCHPYLGWQKQPEGETVQSCLEQALSSIANDSIHVTCAGRTDSGVHALQQVVHFETTANRQFENWVRGTNSLLPPEIRIHWAKQVADHFSARFSAQARRYRYVIHNSPIRSAILHNLVCWQPRLLDVAHMAQASQYLIGEYDFSSFRAAGCQSKSAVRHIHEVTVERVGDTITVNIKANAFLYHMVRNIVGVLFTVGFGEQPPIWVEQLLAARDRKLASPTAVAGGLYLVDVEYPAEFGIPKRGTDNLGVLTIL